MTELHDFANSIAIVVSSCDKFFDTWRPFAFFFRKFWPDCPFPVYLIVNRLQVRSSSIHAINVGRDRGWATNLQTALREVAKPYILYMQDDYFLAGLVNQAQLANDFAYAFEQEAASFCFYGRDPAERGFSPINDRFGIVSPDSDFRTICQVTLWKRDVLLSALRSGETAWDMEARGSVRTRDLLILSYRQAEDSPIPYLKTAVVRGLWLPEALALCRQHNFTIRPRFRPTYTPSLSGRRFRRAIGRVTYSFAFLKQRLMKPIDLDV
jgi:hypothetical protein